MKKLAVFALSGLIVISLSGCALLYPNWSSTQNPGTSESANPSESASSSESASPSPSATPKKAAKVQIDQLQVDATNGVIAVLASVANFNEDGGQCTLTFIGGGVTKQLTVKAESNVTTTQCYPMEMPLTGLPKGKGSVTVSYDDRDHAGTSSASSVVIP